MTEEELPASEERVGVIRGRVSLVITGLDDIPAVEFVVIVVRMEFGVMGSVKDKTMDDVRVDVEADFKAGFALPLVEVEFPPLSAELKVK